MTVTTFGRMYAFIVQRILVASKGALLDLISTEILIILKILSFVESWYLE